MEQRRTLVKTEKQMAKYDAMITKANEKYIGKKYNSLTIISFSRFGHYYHKYFMCKCDCGTIKEISLVQILNGDSKSCGCLYEKNKHGYNLVHGDSKSRLYNIWCAMKRRCFDKNEPLYYGRGISVCKEWMQYKSFQKWSLENGYNEKLTIDRIDNNGDYCPTNCRWTDWTTQNRNKRNNIYLEFNGEKKLLAEWAQILNIGIKTLWGRRRLGWTDEKIITTPLHKRITGDN